MDPKISKTMYKKKICTFMYDVAMGMKLGHEWDGKHDVSGGYIIVNKDGSLTAYHTTAEDQFKDYLFSQLQFEKPSVTRHKYMKIYKENGEFYLKLNLQLRFPKL